MRVDKQLARVAIALCDSVSSNLSLSIKKMIEEDRLEDLVSQEIDPNQYSNAILFLKDAACVNLLRKVPFEIKGVDRRKAALTSFFSSERQCCETNVVFNRHLSNGPFGLLDTLSIQFLDRARGWLQTTLGSLPASLDIRFGPGATYSDRGRLTTVPDKITNSPLKTANVGDLDRFIYETAWGRELVANSKVSSSGVVRGNRFTTVPKDALKDRGICIEPSSNVCLQLAVGKCLKARLLHAGLDLAHGQEKHRLWAQLGSLHGHLATLDLSNASDTVSYQLVRHLLPAPWFELLDALRSPFTFVEGRWVRLEKFSSMGNGYTFELETLIFSSLCFAAGCGKAGEGFLVFGDDMIVPSGKAQVLCSLLSYCGFSLNRRKSFLGGPFRESCGGDFFLGVPVRSHFLKEIPHEPQHWISLANGLNRLGLQDPLDYFRCSFSRNAWRRCLDSLPSNIRRLTGPSILGDLVIHAPYVCRWRNGIGYVKVYRPIAKPLPWHHWHPHVVYASILYGCGTARGVIPRGNVSGYKIGYVCFS